MKSTAIVPPYFFVRKKLEKKLKKFLTNDRVCDIINSVVNKRKEMGA